MDLYTISIPKSFNEVSVIRYPYGYASFRRMIKLIKIDTNKLYKDKRRYASSSVRVFYKIRSQVGFILFFKHNKIKHMKTRNYQEHEVVAQLERKHDIVIQKSEKTIYEIRPPKSKGDVGIKSRGKIDFLKKYCGYTYVMVSEEFVRNLNKKPK